jgi:hypothetical protein
LLPTPARRSWNSRKPPSPNAPGTPPAWPAFWANDGTLKAKEAYQSITIIDSFILRNQLNFHVNWEGRAVYNNRCAPIVLEQMRPATLTLALLVNTLFG